MRAGWILKGGTCIKKCYVETYRFSEDLDFSLLPDASYSEAAIRETLAILARIGSELSGIDFPKDMIQFRARRDKLGRSTFEGRVAYHGPLGVPARFPTALPRVIFDITRHEPVFDPPSPRLPFHPYPDLLPDGLSVLTYSLNELLAEKARALYERTRPRDLYDVVYLLENQPGGFNFPRVCELFGMKCAVKEFEAPLAADLLRVAETTVSCGATPIRCTGSTSDSFDKCCVDLFSMRIVSPVAHSCPREYLASVWSLNMCSTAGRYGGMPNGAIHSVA